MDRRTLLSGVAAGAVGVLLAGCGSPSDDSDDPFGQRSEGPADGTTADRSAQRGRTPSTLNLARLNVGSGFDSVPEREPGVVNVRGRFPQLALQGDSAAKYSGVDWFDADGRRVAALVADLPDEDVSMYAASPDGMRKAFDLHYGGEALRLNFKNTRSLFVSGGDARTGNTIIGIQAGSERGDSILRFVDAENESVWGLLRDASTDEDLRVENYRTGETALTVSGTTNAFDFNQNATVGLREIEDPTPDDLRDHEWAWDATDDRWLYRDDGGTVHYFEPDGEL